jgi:2-methylcitrate dehydratase
MILIRSAEFHSQTAVEAAQRLNKKLKAMGKSAKDIEGVVNRTHEACIRIIDKQFKPMENFADRDHCVQVSLTYMTHCLVLTVMVVHGRHHVRIQPP